MKKIPFLIITKFMRFVVILCLFTTHTKVKVQPGLGGLQVFKRLMPEPRNGLSPELTFLVPVLHVSTLLQEHLDELIVTSSTSNCQCRVVITLRLGVHLHWGVWGERGHVVDPGRGRWGVVDCIRVRNSGGSGESEWGGDAAGERWATLGADGLGLRWGLPGLWW